MIRQALLILGLLGVQYFSWASHSVTLFNGLATPLFLVLAAYLAFLSTQYTIEVSPPSLILYLIFAAWVVCVDARSGEFLPALAKDTHWFILPVAALLIAQVLRDDPKAMLLLRAGAALCIINLILTLYVRSEWNDNWHHPPYFGHIRHLGLSIGFLTILLYVREETKGWLSVFFRICRILGLALMFWSGTRSSMLGWICCILIFTFSNRRWAGIMISESIAAVLLSIIHPPPLPNGFGGVIGSVERTINSVTTNALTTNRLAIWQSALSELENLGRSWTGLGGNGFARLQVMHDARLVFPGHVQAHSVIVQSICDWGYPGLLLLTAFFYQSTVRLIALIRSSFDPTGLGCLVYLVITGMLDATLYHLEHLNYLALSCALLMGGVPAQNGKLITLPKFVVLSLLAGFVLIHALTLDYRIGLYWYFPTGK